MTTSGDIGSTVNAGYVVLVNPNDGTMNVDPDAFGNADLMNLSYSVTDLVADVGVIAGSNVALTLPSQLLSGQSVNVPVSVTIPGDALEGTYTGTVTVSDTVAGVSDVFTLVVQVNASEQILILVDTLRGEGNDNQTISIPFQVVNLGNNKLTSVTFLPTMDLVSTNAGRIPREMVVFTPPVVDTLPPGDTVEVTVDIRVPEGIISGIYYGEIEVRDDDGTPYDKKVVELTVTSRQNVSFDNSIVTGRVVMIGYKADPGFSPTLTIINVAGDAVYSSIRLPAANQFGEGTYSLSLVNPSGQNLAPGIYLAVIRTQIDGKPVNIIRKFLVLR